MLGIPNPGDIASAIVTGINQFIELRRLNQWAKLIFEIVFSFWVSGTFVCGGSLVAHSSTPVAVGLGLTAGAVHATVIFRGSPLTSGLMVALPEKEAEAELNADLQVIEKK